MIRLKLNYIALQVINAVFLTLSCLFLKSHLVEDGSDKMGMLLFLFPVLMCGVYVFFTNRIFYALAKPGDD